MRVQLAVLSDFCVTSWAYESCASGIEEVEGLLDFLDLI